MTAPTLNRLAARAVAVHCPGSPAERRQILDMLGLIDADGNIAPDDTRFIDVDRISSADPLERMIPPTPVFRAPRELVPAGLAAYDPNPPAPAAAPRPRPATPRARKKKEKPAKAVVPRPPAPPGPYEKCGTMAGRSSHFRRGELPCRACKDAQNAYQRAKRAERGAIPMVPTERPPKADTVIRDICGTPGGRSKHQRMNEKMCQACNESFNVARRARIAARRAAKAVGITGDTEERSA